MAYATIVNIDKTTSFAVCVRTANTRNDGTVSRPQMPPVKSSTINWTIQRPCRWDRSSPKRSRRPTSRRSALKSSHGFPTMVGRGRHSDTRPIRPIPLWSHRALHPWQYDLRGGWMISREGICGGSPSRRRGQFYRKDMAQIISKVNLSWRSFPRGFAYC